MSHEPICRVCDSELINEARAVEEGQLLVAADCKLCGRYILLPDAHGPLGAIDAMHRLQVSLLAGARHRRTGKATTIDGDFVRAAPSPWAD